LNDSCLSDINESLDTTTYNFNEIFDEESLNKFNSLLKSNQNGHILFIDEESNIWEIVKRKDLSLNDFDNADIGNKSSLASSNGDNICDLGETIHIKTENSDVDLSNLSYLSNNVLNIAELLA
jgi:hypothetical protein